MNAYRLYGHSLCSEWPVPAAGLETFPSSGTKRIEIRKSSEPLNPQDITEDVGRSPLWFRHASLPDEGLYLRWSQFFEFLVSADGCHIVGRPLGPDADTAFEHFLLARILSCAMVKQGTEPLHGTVSLVDGSAVCFLGDCGYGKSTLAAAFLKAGYPLVTDDLIVLREDGDSFRVQPGPSRIKLFPEMAEYFFGPGSTGTPINSLATKQAFSLDTSEIVPSEVSVRAIYVLDAASPEIPVKEISIVPLSQSAAFFALIRNTFNAVVTDSQRISRQFSFAHTIASTLPVKSLSYPRDLSFLTRVVEAVAADLSAPRLP